MQGLTFVFHLNHFHLYYLSVEVKKTEEKTEKSFITFRRDSSCEDRRSESRIGSKNKNKN